MSATRALCCVGRGGAARGPVDRGVFLRRVVAVPSMRTGLVSGYIDSLGWVSVVRFEAAVIRLWGVLRGWVHGPWKIVAVDGAHDLRHLWPRRSRGRIAVSTALAGITGAILGCRGW